MDNTPPCRDENVRALTRALGIDPVTLAPRTRAAIEALCEEVLALRGDVDDLKARLQNSELLADNDALCPVFNRRAFEREVRREIALAARFGTPLSMIFIDLDRFKAVNDLYGHATGDRALIRVSEILLANTRDTDIVGRLGGDEFGLMLAQADLNGSEQKAASLAEQIDALMVQDTQRPNIPAVQLGASCGVAEWQSGDDDARFIARADEAMFLEKARRRERGNSPKKLISPRDVSS